jgi:hypothetical protein
LGTISRNKNSKNLRTKVKKIREKNPITKISKIWEQKLQKSRNNFLKKSENKSYKNLGTKFTKI